ncbi:MAG: sigma-70 family RNA polymerase sigma factor [Akkermansiaceae bacterium]|nr:sigma-70 family RNA polymerase sigma factor [Akkermansiaceae bacterium]
MASSEFPMTRWSVVLSARDEDASKVKAALSELCEAYWMPLYSFARRTGKSAEDAEDLTQAFFARLIEKDLFARANAERGKLRSFLLGTFKNFLSDEWDKSRALKRGGGKEVFSIDAAEEEERFAMEPADEESPDRCFEKRWALVVLDRVMRSLRDHYLESGKGEVFEELSQFLAPESGGQVYRKSAEVLGLSENAVRVAVFRMRQRYAGELRAQIAETVEGEAEVAEEIDFLFRAVQ